MSLAGSCFCCGAKQDCSGRARRTRCCWACWCCGGGTTYSCTWCDGMSRTGLSAASWLCLTRSPVWLQRETERIMAISTCVAGVMPRSVSPCTRPTVKRLLQTAVREVPSQDGAATGCHQSRGRVMAPCAWPAVWHARHTSHDQTGGGWTGCAPPCAHCRPARDASWAPP